MDLDKIIKPIPALCNSYDVNFSDITRWLEKEKDDADIFELIPEFQRGHVWTKEQQIYYMENVLRFEITPVIMFNFTCYWGDKVKCKNGLKPNQLSCIDGLQRLTALTKFINDDLLLFNGQIKASDLDCSRYSIKRRFARINFYDICDYKDLLQFYLDINSGGTQHSESEISRVSKLLESIK